MRVLVTGAAGFIGSHVVDDLVAQGYDVVALDGLLPPIHAAAEWPTWLHPAADRKQLDLRNQSGIDAALEGIDAVVHQAALVGHGLDIQDLPRYAGLTDLGTAELLAGMARHNIGNLVLASSMVVYGEGRYRCADHGLAETIRRTQDDLSQGEFEPRCPECSALLAWEEVPEAAPKNPQSVYATSKLAQEHYCAAWSRITGGRATFLRYHNVYGPRMPLDSPYSGVAAIFRSQLENGVSPSVFEDGQQMRDFVHVTDVARANRVALEALDDSPPGGLPLNVCSGQPRSVGWAAEALAEELAGPPPRVTGQYRAEDVRHVVASPQSAQETIGFFAQMSPEEGFREFAHDPMRVTKASQ